ncbi:MAG: alanine racemase, partial [Balneolaceae bacterium]
MIPYVYPEQIFLKSTTMDSTFLQPSYIELDYQALEENIRFLQSMGSDQLKISSVIKGNAYGHGISSFLPMAEKAGIDHFSVFSVNEAERAIRHKTNKDTVIMIIGMIRDDEIEWAIHNGIEIYLFEQDRLHAAIRAGKRTGMRAKVHLQLETGMNRTGFDEKELKKVIEILKSNSDTIEVVGICTHFAGAETIANHYRIQNQDKIFRELVKWVQNELGQELLVHASSSAAFLTYPEKHYDMVRIGIAQYGFWPSRETYMYHIKNEGLNGDIDPLRRVLTWKSEVMSLKKVKGGDFVGYGNVFLAGHDMTIATVPIGYTHGFGRNLTNTGYVLIKGVRCGVVGLVSMNMITVNVSHVDDVQKGDEVVLIGKQGKDEITVASFGEMTNDLNYEVLT